MEKVILGGAPRGDILPGLMTHPQVSDTLGSLGRVPACTGVHFRMLLIFGSAEGKGFLKENPVFLKDLQEKEKELERN